MSLLAGDAVDHVTAIDTSEEALAIARSKITDISRVTLVTANVFDWHPPRKFDIVAFGFWLSHIPPGRFEAFWDLVARALCPGGRVFFTDNAAPPEQIAAANGRQVETPRSRMWLESGVSLRTLADSREFHIIKRSWTVDELERELASLGWWSAVRDHRGLFIDGRASKRTAP